MKRMDQAILDEFVGLCSMLSPENLHCDGEISMSQAKKKLAIILKEWKKLEKKIGFEVSEDEVWEQYFSSKVKI